MQWLGRQTTGALLMFCKNMIAASRTCPITTSWPRHGWSYHVWLHHVLSGSNKPVGWSLSLTPRAQIILSVNMVRATWTNPVTWSHVWQSVSNHLLLNRLRSEFTALTATRVPCVLMVSTGRTSPIAWSRLKLRRSIRQSSWFRHLATSTRHVLGKHVLIAARTNPITWSQCVLRIQLELKTSRLRLSAFAAKLITCELQVSARSARPIARSRWEHGRRRNLHPIWFHHLAPRALRIPSEDVIVAARTNPIARSKSVLSV